MNAVVLGSAAIHQAILTSGLGYVLYLTRRVSGGIVVPILLHWLIDFSLFSNEIGRGEVPVSDAAFALVLAEIVVVIAALMTTIAGDRRQPKKRAPTHTPAATSATTASASIATVPVDSRTPPAGAKSVAR